MKPNARKWIVVYVLYGIAALAVFLYLRFPGDALRDFLAAAVSGRCPGAALSVGSVKADFPPGVKMQNVVFTVNGNANSSIRADRLTARPGFLSLLRGRSSLVWSADAYEGSVKGDLLFGSLLSSEGPVDAELKWNDIRVGQCAGLRDLFGRQITGTLRGLMTYKGRFNGLANAAGRLEFTLVDGSFPLIGGMFGLEKIDFKVIRGEMKLGGETLVVNELNLTGEKLRCSLKGNILLGGDLRNCPIELNGIMEIPTLNNKKVNVIVTGTLGNPATRFL